MGLWPFSGGKKARTSQKSEDQSPNTLLEKSQTDLGVRRNTSSTLDLPIMGRPGLDEKPRRLSKQRLQPQPRNVSRVQTAPINVPGPASQGYRRSSGNAGLEDTDLYLQNPISQTSIGPEEFTALPTAPSLLAKRPGFDPALHRRKSSKRKAEDFAREREVRAMTSPIQRPTTYSSSGLLRRDTKQIPGNLNMRLQRPTSEVSLPLSESIQESQDMSNQASFKIGFLAALSPRPTLTYVPDPRTSIGKQVARLKPNVQQAIEEEGPSSRKRINELADDLDSGGLRELMERDRKRREKKKEADRAHLERKLQRRADRQREEELRGRRPGNTTENLMAFTPRDREKAVMRSLGSDADTSPTPLPKDPRERTGGATDPFADPQTSPARPAQTIRNPFEDEKDFDVMHDSLATEEEDPPVPVRSPLRTVPATQFQAAQKPMQAATISPPISPVQQPSDRNSLSQTSALGRQLTPEIPEQKSVERRASDQSGQQLTSWTSFFRRGGRRKPSMTERGRTTPSEFSNTSRESFVARKQQPPPIVASRTFRKSDASSIPQRTMSKFREDLPELPISPPDSRVQSPEATVNPGAGQTSRQPRQSTSGRFDDRSLATSSSGAGMDHAVVEPQQHRDGDVDMEEGPSAAVLSRSLASVDSEGSWLSGRPPKRLSGPMGHPLRQSLSSIPPHDDDDLANDEYLNRLTPGPSGQRDSVTSADRRASSNVIDLERERQKSPVPDVPHLPAGPDETWHTGVGRQPTVVRQATRAKSREGLLKEAGHETTGGSRRASLEGEDDDEVDLAGEPTRAELQGATLMRASSVDYKDKGHARHMSAGSARLLDIRRSSIQSDGGPRSPGLPQIVPQTTR